MEYADSLDLAQKLKVVGVGDGGGFVVASGTPEAVAAVEESYTGQYLKHCL
jgi:excinuclease UvrABC ATPase subunit